MTASPPGVSIIIPAYFSDRTLAECLEALRRQTFRDFEVIVINSSPEARTEQLVRSRFPEVTFEQSPVRLLPHAARNRGVVRARGALLVFTDPDCCAEADWLAYLVSAHREGHPLVGGSMGVIPGRRLEYGIHLRKFFWLLPGLPAGPCRIICTANAAYSRAIWDRLGPLRGDLFTGDALFSLRACASGIVPWFEPRAIVKHRHEGSLAAYFSEFLDRGREFGIARADLEQWAKPRAAMYLVLTPAIAALMLGRAGRYAVRSGWGAVFLTTLPVQSVCVTAWSIGEARACWKRIAS